MVPWAAHSSAERVTSLSCSKEPHVQPCSPESPVAHPGSPCLSLHCGSAWRQGWWEEGHSPGLRRELLHLLCMQSLLWAPVKGVNGDNLRVTAGGMGVHVSLM